MLDFIPNQKVVKINREKVDKGTGSGRNYLIAYQDNISAASRKFRTENNTFTAK